MNTKHLKNWLRAALSLQQICEIDGCTGKAEYCISQFHGRSIRVCPNHVQNAVTIQEEAKNDKQ